MNTHKTRRTDEILARARALVQESEQAYEQFLDAWGIDRDAVGCAARGEHIRMPERRRMLDRALEHVDLPEPPPTPVIAGVDPMTPPHGIRC